ncbi:hypothetical protein ALC57_15196 [Trachymyrmex cornetzi]|uniref:Uncharacterized protein n=1 Tax=Trachymyrmex cornetzi TaxID=471704 RepID=A0A195DIY7_9HYME|nr:hypothetical protein ALC57_15196 [Trachymyrmex cornetzi]
MEFVRLVPFDQDHYLTPFVRQVRFPVPFDLQVHYHHVPFVHCLIPFVRVRLRVPFGRQVHYRHSFALQDRPAAPICPPGPLLEVICPPGPLITHIPVGPLGPIETGPLLVWDLVTQYNRKIKAILMDNLAKKFPTHIGEEFNVMSSKLLAVGNCKLAKENS